MGFGIRRGKGSDIRGMNIEINNNRDIII
jgi:hypothetical protein